LIFRSDTAASTAKGREQLLAQIAASQARVHARFQQTKALLHEHLAWKTMLERNQLEKEKENHSIADVSMTEHVKDETAKDTVTAPFVLLRVPEDAEVGLLVRLRVFVLILGRFCFLISSILLQVTSDRQHVSLVFSHPFRVYDDHSLIQQLCPLPDESQLEVFHSSL
jgi:predicted nuclease of restriction endonuclease-like (RecB) superfamily